jgi:protein-tyrosine kinase
MSAEPLHPEEVTEPATESDQAICDAVVLFYKLPEEAVENINEAKKALGVSFAEAAIHTGLVTETEIDRAREWVRRQSVMEGRSIIEEALRRRSHGRDLILWEGEKLTPGKQLLIAHEPYHERSEAIRSLRTDLLMRTNGRRGAAMFALLSPCGGEGRSQLCAELAIAFAQLGSRTLLVDADMRRPRLHHLFGADNSVGLAQALVDAKTLRAHPIEGVPKLALLTAGALPPNPLELLSGRSFERMAVEWRRSYEFVVMDTPPVAQYSDGLAVAAMAGYVVLLGRTNSTPFSALAELRRKLDTSQSWVVGAVMSSF